MHLKTLKRIYSETLRANHVQNHMLGCVCVFVYMLIGLSGCVSCCSNDCGRVQPGSDPYEPYYEVSTMQLVDSNS